MATPCPGGYEIYNSGRPTLGHHDYMYILSLYNPCSRVEKNVFKEIHQFYTFTPTLSSLGVEG